MDFFAFSPHYLACKLYFFALSHPPANDIYPAWIWRFNSKWAMMNWWIVEKLKSCWDAKTNSVAKYSLLLNLFETEGNALTVEQHFPKMTNYQFWLWPIERHWPITSSPFIINDTWGYFSPFVIKPLNRDLPKMGSRGFFRSASNWQRTWFWLILAQATIQTILNL